MIFELILINHGIDNGNKPTDDENSNNDEG
jgi:hypothetical protein